MGYTHELSAFPNTPINLPKFKDVDDTVKTLVEQVRQYRIAGNYSAVASLINSNRELLRQYNFTAEDVNRIVEDIRNTQLYVQSKKQQFYYTASRGDFIGADQDVWIGPK